MDSSFNEKHGISPPTSSESSLGPHGLRTVERNISHEYGSEEDFHVPVVDKKAELRLLAKIDWRIMPILCIMFTLAFLDKVNIANAATFDLAKDLKLKGTQYNNCLVVQYVPYLVLEIPSNMLMKKFSPHVWLSSFMFLFGIICMTQGFVQSYGGLVTARFFLGIAEVPMFPGAFYVISMWYRRQEALKRFAFFYNSISLAGAFGGLLAYAIGHMEGLRGYSGWRWIFIVEGAVTASLAIPFFFLLPDFPEDAKWVTPEERGYIRKRLAIDQGYSGLQRPMALKDVVDMFSDWKVWIAGLLYFGCAMPGYAYSFFAPTIIKHFGYGAVTTQLYSVAPWAGAWVFGMMTAFVSDRVRHRFGFIIMGMCVSIAGIATLLSTSYHRVHLQYGMMFMFIMGIYAALPVIVCWFNMNLGGHHRRAIGGAWQIGIGQVGGIVSVYTFLSKDAPNYTPGYSICLAFDVFTIFMAVAYFWGCRRENKKRDQIMRSQSGEGVVSLHVVGDKREKEDLGDRALDYRYMI